MSMNSIELMTSGEFYRRLENERGNEYKQKYTQSVLLGFVLENGDSLTNADFRALNVNKLILGNGIYKVMIFNAETVGTAEGGMVHPNSREYAYYVCSSAVQALMGSHFIIYSGEIGGKYAALLCLLNDFSEDVAREVDKVVFMRLSEIVSACREYGVEVEYTYSLFHVGVASIPKAYRQAQDVRRFDHFALHPLHERCVMASDSGNGGRQETKRIKGFSDELYSLLRLSDMERAKARLPEIVDEIVYMGHHSVDEVLRRYGLMLFFLYEQLETDPAYADVREAVLVAGDSVQISNEQELAADLGRILSLLGSSGHGLNVAERTAERAKEYIDSHLTDMNLSVTCAADELGVNPNTLSGRFKRMFGVSMADYIHRERVGMAVKLLATTKLPLAEICRLCGYGSVNTLYRAFEKYRGRSPSEYRSDISIDSGGEKAAGFVISDINRG